MRITVWSKKGGVGKTSLAYNIARDLDYFLISNDESIIEIAYPDKTRIMEQPKIIDNCVYDLGGFVDEGIKDILNNSDLIIVPILNDLNSFKKTLLTLQELDLRKTIIVANKATREDFKEIEEFFKKKNLRVFEIPESRIFKKSFAEKKSINEIVNKSKLNKYTYRNISKKYNELLNFINNFKQNLKY